MKQHTSDPSWPQERNEQPLDRPVQRRSFLKAAGLTTATGLLFVSGCRKFDDIFDILHPKHHTPRVNLGSGDIGVLNYAYTLEQLEAAFYTLVVAMPFSGMNSWEWELLTDVRDHEIAHREFLKTALGSHAIADIEVDFDKIDFHSRDSVLATAMAFEDLGVSAYNGAGQLLSNADYLAIAGKIVSVEARHAAYFRDLVKPGSFAGSDVVDNHGLDTSRNPSQVLKIADPYIKTKVDASHLPTS